MRRSDVRVLRGYARRFADGSTANPFPTRTDSARLPPERPQVPFASHVELVLHDGVRGVDGFAELVAAFHLHGVARSRHVNRALAGEVKITSLAAMGEA